jgi:hypothetical protein
MSRLKQVKNFEKLGSNAHQKHLPNFLKCQNWDWRFFQKKNELHNIQLNPSIWPIEPTRLLRL